MTRDERVARYRHLTGTVLPRMAQSDPSAWPVHADHCFQRIVLDAICGGVWADHLRRPAYKHLDAKQAEHAVDLSEALAEGRADIWELNAASLAVRAARRAEPPAQARLL
ncbi:MAG: hypothetical protein AB3N17_16525 [Tateyamaria sp.]